MRHVIVIINENGFCSLLCDKGKDTANQELLTIVLRIALETFNAKEFFFKFYALDNIKSKCIHMTIKVRSCIHYLLQPLLNCKQNILLSINIAFIAMSSLVFSRVSNMLREKTSATFRIKREIKRILDIHYLRYSLNLSVAAITKLPKE